MSESKPRRVRSSGSRIARAIDVAKPKWLPDSGSWLPNETFIVATGRVQWFKADAYTLVATKSANLRVKWAGDGLPPSVFVGKKVHFIGRFKTYNDGKIFMVVDALPIIGEYRGIAKPVLAYLYQFAEDPRDWAEEESLKHLFIQDLP